MDVEPGAAWPLLRMRMGDPAREERAPGPSVSWEDPGLGATVIPLADGGALECVDGYDATAERIVFTIGYEGRTVGEVIEELRRHAVGLLVDIREAPVSKRRGFSKAQLEAALRKADIRYVFKRDWGNPNRKAGGRDPRRAFRVAMTRYTAHLAPHIVDAAAFIAEVLAERPAFLCYEAEPFRCHRSRFTSLVLPHCQPQPAVHHILPPVA